MSFTIPALELGTVTIGPDHVWELRVLLAEVRKQQYVPIPCGHNNSAAVELAGYLRALLGPEPTPPRPHLQEPAPARPRQPT